jgi:hypothetical protein
VARATTAMSSAATACDFAIESNVF